MTFVDIVNDVLLRLREDGVSSVQLTSYSRLIGKFVNDAKRQIEDAYDWNALGREITVTTSSGTYEYSLTGAGGKFRVTSDPINTTSNVIMRNTTSSDMRAKQNLLPIATAVPTEYAFDGVDSNGDAKVVLYGRPNGVYSIKFFLAVPQAPLVNDSDVPLIASELIAQNAYARALVERGEDGGLSSSEAYSLYRAMLADYIALEATRFPEMQEFYAS